MAAPGCTADAETVQVGIVYTDTAGRKLQDVSVVAGKDRFFWPELAAGRESVTLKPGREDDQRLTLLYRLNGNAKSWVGPALASTVRGYRIELRIDSAGAVTSRHCVLPCTLD